jgi:hypothetical protein
MWKTTTSPETALSAILCATFTAPANRLIELDEFVDLMECAP